MKLGLLVVLAVAVLVPRLYEGRIVSRSELKEKLGKAIVLPKKLQVIKEKILERVVWEVSKISRLNTRLVKLYGKCRTTTTAKPTSDSTTESTDSTTESSDSTTESSDSTTESSDKTTESSDSTTESSDKTTESSDSTTESSDKTTESSDSTTESSDSTTESSDKTTESSDSTTESSDSTTESSDKTTESSDSTTESSDKTTESSDSTTESSDSTPLSDSANVDTASKESELTERDGNLMELVKKVWQDDKSMDEESDWGLESDESDEGRVMLNDDVMGYKDEESDEDVLPLDDNSMANKDRRQDSDIIDEKDEESDEGGLELDDNMTGDADEDSNEEDSETEDEEEDAGEDWKRKKRHIRRWWPRRKLKVSSGGRYGLFQLSDSTFCDSGYRKTKNKCNTDCSAFIDDDIMDDIDCIVKTGYWKRFYKKSSRRY